MRKATQKGALWFSSSSSGFGTYTSNSRKRKRPQPDDLSAHIAAEGLASLSQQLLESRPLTDVSIFQVSSGPSFSHSRDHHW
jgi:hypothetical protein